MTETGSIEQLFALAIQAEHFAETLYQEIANRFNRNPEVERFWLMYALEEKQHARWLGMLRDRLSPEQLAAPANPTAFEMATRAVSVSLEKLLGRIKTLQDAYVLANQIEHDEVNAVFEFLISHFAEDPQVMDQLRAELSKHIRHLSIDFPRSYGTGTLRRGFSSN